MTKIGIILGSTRPGPQRRGRRPVGLRRRLAAHRRRVRARRPPRLQAAAPRRGRCRRRWASTPAAHPGVGRQDRLVRRLRLRHARVQPLHVRRAEERHRLPVRRVEQQGRRLRRLRRGRRRPRGRAPAADRGRAADGRRARTRSRCRCSPTSRTSACSARRPPARGAGHHCWTRSSPGARRSRRCAPADDRGRRQGTRFRGSFHRESRPVDHRGLPRCRGRCSPPEDPKRGPVASGTGLVGRHPQAAASGGLRVLAGGLNPPGPRRSARRRR